MFPFLLLLITSVYADAFPPNECLEQCTGIMQSAADSISNGLFDSLPQFSWSQLYEASQKPEYALQTYQILCNAYKRADACLDSCQGSTDVASRIRQSYASLKIVCVDQKAEKKSYTAKKNSRLFKSDEEFLDILPCFVRTEHIVIEQCKGDINGTLGVINVFNEAVKERNQHHIQSSIANLCRSINQLAKCLEKPTIQHCGRRAADMVLRYIALGFSGFEILYEQMKITDQLPQSCLQLSSLALYHHGNRITVSRHKMIPKDAPADFCFFLYLFVYILTALILL